jgi:hypothetical protein
MKNLMIGGPVFNYHQFFNWTRVLVAQGQSSGNNTSSELIKYTALNFKRMERLNKTIKLSDKLLTSIQAISKHQIWYVITETWCGDSAQNLPVIGKLAELSNGKIDLRIILRDLNPLWIDTYHTNGSKSIPKLIAFDSHRNELFTWGPRPKEAQEILMAWKTNPNGKSWDEFELELHTWYSKNKTISTQNEIYEKIKSTEAIFTNTFHHSE